MPGLQTSAHALIVNLKKLLDDQYDVASIPKELLQNAEDARASQLHFAWVDAPDLQGHPLFSVPALVVVNDGEFTWNDSQKIPMQGLGGKGSDEGAIGKFGLGMKSVFNLGEALFYLASPDQDASRVQAQEKASSTEHEGTKDAAHKIAPQESWHFRECLNPWTGTNQHSDWQLDDPEVESSLHESILKILSGFEPCQGGRRWFALYLPLRSQSLLNGGGALNSLDCVPSKIFTAEMPCRLATLWPMLRHLKEVKVWTFREGKFVSDFTYALSESKWRKGGRLPLKTQCDQVFPLEGCIERRQTQNAGRRALNEKLWFCGREVLLDDSAILEGEWSERWPRTWVWSEGDFEYQREKGEPHVAAVWMNAPLEEKGQLHIGAGVFLPLPDAKIGEEGQSENFAIGNQGGVRLLLHGYFFVDGGRRHLVLDDRAVQDTPREKPESMWNRRLLERGVLPLVLESLDGFARKTRLDETQLREITRALRASQWHQRHAGALTKNWAWVYRLSGPPALDMTRSKLAQAKAQKEASVGSWTLQSPASSFWRLPAPPHSDVKDFDGARSVFTWFPGLTELAGSHVLTWTNWPHIVAQEPSLWTEEEILKALRGLNHSEVFKTPLALAYLNELLDSFGETVRTPEISTRLRRVALDALTNWRAAYAKSPELVAQWRRFWDAIPRDSWVPFLPRRADDSDTGRQELLSAMLGLELEKLPVPPDMVSLTGSDSLFDDTDRERGEGLWSLSDAEKLARWLQSQLEEQSEEQPVEKTAEKVKNQLKKGATEKPKATTRTKVKAVLFRALDLVETTHGSRLEKERVLGSWKIFSVCRWQNDGETDLWASWLEMNAWNDANLLWGVALEGQMRTGTPLLKIWQSISLGEPVLSINETGKREISTALWGDNKPDNFGPRACLSLLTQTPPLAPPTERRVLWDHLKRPADMELLSYNIAVRYFLHGNPERRNEEAPLLYAPKDVLLWRKVAQPAMAQRGEEWRLLAPELSSASLGDLKDDIGLERLDASQARDALELVGSDVAGLRFELSDSEAREVLCKCQCSREVWRALPLHSRKNGGNRVSVDEATFWEAEIPIPDFLAGRVKLLERPNGDLLELYKTHGVSAFGPEQVLELALSDPAPHRFAGIILDSVLQIGDDISSSLVKSLRSTAWICGESPELQPFAPCDLILLKPLERELQSLLKQRNSPQWRENDWHFAWEGDIASAWRNHRGWKRLGAVLPTPRDSCETLVEVLESVGEEFFLGPLPSLTSNPETILEAWDASGSPLPRGVSLLKALFEYAGTKEYAPDVACALCETVMPNRLVSQLEGLQKATNSPVAMELHREIWALLCDHPDASPSDLSSLNFPAQDLNWKTTGNLCLDGSGLELSAVLHEDWAVSLRYAPLGLKLRGVGRTVPGNESALQKKAPQQSWRKILNSWQAPLGSATEVLAAFSALVDTGGTIEDIAASFWRKGAYQLVWEQLTGSEAEANRWKEKLYQFPLEVEWRDFSTSTVEAINLLGEAQTFKVGSHLSTLVIGQVRRPDQTGSGFRVEMRQVDAARFSKSQWTQILRATMETLLREYGYYHRSSPGFFEDRLAHYFPSWTGGRQADLQIAQSYILDNALFYFRTLSGKIGLDLKNIIARYDTWRYTKHEQDGIEGHNNADSFERIRYDLQRLIERDTDLAAQSLEMVRAKMRQLGYESNSIPFELLQNADDAVSELRVAWGDDWDKQQDDKTRVVSLEITPHNRDPGYTWRWTHQGRGINQFRLGRVTGDQGREAGYNRDLEKMLVLQASDKSDNTQNAPTTGKFGLGFKSVFLASGHPQIVSGDLTFEVIGGFYPRALKESEKSTLWKPAEGGDLAAPPTILQFASNLEPPEIMRRMARLGIFALGFARQIRRLEYIYSGKVRALEWQETMPFTGVGIGVVPLMTLDIGSAVQAPLPMRALIIRVNGGALCLGLDDNGVCALPLDIPAFWVTAPTRSEARVGWALNGNWSVDVGRAQLAFNRENEHEAERLGREVGSVLNSLWRQCADFENVRVVLGIDARSREEFWRDLGKVLAPPISGGLLLQKFHEKMRAALPQEGHRWFEVPEANFTTAGVEIESRSFIVPDNRPDSKAHLDEIARWWERNRDQTFQPDRHPFFVRPELVYPFLNSGDDAKRRAAWMRLLLRSTLEGIGQRHWKQHRAFVEFCDQSGWVEEFSRPGADVGRLGHKLEKYLADDEKARRKWVQWMRHSLPLFGLCHWLDNYIETFHALGKRPKCTDLTFLQLRRDPGWGISSDAPNAPDLGDVLGIGAHFLLRELARPENNAAIFSDDRAHGLCFYPGEKMRLALSVIEPKLADSEGVPASRLAFETLKKHRGQDPTFGGDFDLPLTLWARENPI